MHKTFLLSLVILFVGATFSHGQNVTGLQSAKKIFDLDANSTLADYVEELKKNSSSDFTINLSRAKYYENSQLKIIDSISFTYSAQVNRSKPFSISSATIKSLKDVVASAKEKGILLSLREIKYMHDKEKKRIFYSPALKTENSASERVSLHKYGMARGLDTEIANTIDMADKKAVLEVIDYHPNGKLKKNVTTTVFPSKVTVQKVHKMKEKDIQKSVILFKKSYKYDVQNRPAVIASLFSDAFSDFDWQVLSNATEYFAASDISVVLAVGTDKYDILGNKKRLT